MTPNPEKAEADALAWCDAWNRRDLEAVLAHYADDVTLCSPLVVKRFGRSDGVLRGKDELRAYFGKGMTNPALQFNFEGIRHGVNAVTVLYARENGMQVSDTMEFDSAGRALRVTACYAGGHSDV